jgi:hypothetical protein
VVHHRLETGDLAGDALIEVIEGVSQQFALDPRPDLLTRFRLGVALVRHVQLLQPVEILIGEAAIF